MTGNPWAALEELATPNQPDWLAALLTRNAACDYLKQFGSPDTLEVFRERVPPCRYEDLAPYLARMVEGPTDMLFTGRPLAFERTGGSSGGAKLIPYSAEGLLDFQRNIVPWLARTVKAHGITGKAYFSISPALRETAMLGGVPVGLPDGAYLGECAGAIVARQSAVPLEVAGLRDLAQWREATLGHLKAADDLELISVWSPTFLLGLLDDIPNPQALWPNLKVVSCWASGTARRYADQLRERLPHVYIQPKGLLSTEAVVTTPGQDDRPVLVKHGFFEFAQGDTLFLEKQLIPGGEYEVVVTTASGLYRYRSGDRVHFAGRNATGEAILDFVGRDTLTCDLVGEKLTESFVARCLAGIPGFVMLTPDVLRPGYVLIRETPSAPGLLDAVEAHLATNPQYAYARKIGQLAPLRVLVRERAFGVVERAMLARGTRLGDVKPVVLRSEGFWLSLFEEQSP